MHFALLETSQNIDRNKIAMFVTTSISANKQIPTDGTEKSKEKILITKANLDWQKNSLKVRTW